uniref:N-acetyltransferase domain-containing protein n=1 Tax=Sarcophilus harrisii TaxID=9305 RepID=A0A7N4V4D1_SARHA
SEVTILRFCMWIDLSDLLKDALNLLHTPSLGTLTVGFAMYYFTYDPWIGKLLYLEDFYVVEPFRGLGIGPEILRKLSQIAITSGCSCMNFLVVIWNQTSTEYYIKRGARDLSTQEGWHLFRFNKKELLKMANED